MPLRTVDVTKTRRFEDGDAWLEIRTELSKAESDAVNDATSALSPTSTGVEVVQRTAQANQKLFGILAQDWSLGGECNAGAYAGLDKESGDWVDECIAAVLRERRERAEKNSPSSSKRRGRASSSATAVPSV
jgi:hypothetical protein